MVRAGLQRDVSCSPGGLMINLLQSTRLGMRFTSALRPAFGDDLVIAYNNAANIRVWVGSVLSTLR